MYKLNYLHWIYKTSTTGNELGLGKYADANSDGSGGGHGFHANCYGTSTKFGSGLGSKEDYEDRLDKYTLLMRYGGFL